MPSVSPKSKGSTEEQMNVIQKMIFVVNFFGGKKILREKKMVVIGDQNAGYQHYCHFPQFFLFFFFKYLFTLSLKSLDSVLKCYRTWYVFVVCNTKCTKWTTGLSLIVVNQQPFVKTGAIQ